MACFSPRAPEKRARQHRRTRKSSLQQQFAFLTSQEIHPQRPMRARRVEHPTVEELGPPPKPLPSVTEGMVLVRRDGRWDPATGQYIRYQYPVHREYTCTGDTDADEALMTGA